MKRQGMSRRPPGVVALVIALTLPVHIAGQEAAVAFGLNPSDVAAVVGVSACYRPGICTCAVGNATLNHGIANEHCGTIWRDWIKRRYYVARTLPASGYIDAFDSTSWFHIPAEGFGLAAGPARSLAIQESPPGSGTTNLVAAIWNATTMTGTIEIRTTSPPGTLVSSQSCPNVRFDHLTVTCDAQVVAMATSFGPPGPPVEIYVVSVPVVSCGGGNGWIQLSSNPNSNNEYIVPDVKRSLWMATSSGPNRMNGTLYKLLDGVSTPIAFPGIGGRHVMPDYPELEAGSCTDPLKPFVYVVQQDDAGDPPAGRIMRIDQNGTVRNEVRIWANGPAPYFNIDADMLWPINVEADVPLLQHPLGGRIWVSFRDRTTGGAWYFSFSRTLVPVPQPPCLPGTTINMLWPFARCHGTALVNLVSPCCLPAATGPARR